MSGQILGGMSDTEYHASSAIGSTSLKTLAKYPPAMYRHMADNPQPHKAAFDIGHAAHALILEGNQEAFEAVDADSWRTKAAKEAADDIRARGKAPLLMVDAEKVYEMRDAVMLHPVAGELFIDHAPELSFFTELHGVPVKARADAVNGTTVVDLKTTSADLNDIARTVNNFGYYIQEAHYTDVIRECGQVVDDFVFVFVSTQAPHMVRVIRLDEAAVDLGREHATTALLTYKECSETGRWPGYEAIDTVDLPAWVYYQEENEETEMKL